MIVYAGDKKLAIQRVIPDATFPGMFFCAAAAWRAFLARRVSCLKSASCELMTAIDA